MVRVFINVGKTKGKSDRSKDSSKSSKGKALAPPSSNAVKGKEVKSVGAKLTNGDVPKENIRLVLSRGIKGQVRCCFSLLYVVF